MSLKLLLKDELEGFYKSKVMLFLWIGLPVMVVLFHLFTPDTGDLPYSTIAAVLISSIGGTLAAIMLVVTIVNERTRHIYDLFVIRPIKRRDIILAKFIAVYTCLIVAATFALMLGLVIDAFNANLPPEIVLRDTFESFTVSLSMMGVASAIGIMIGVAVPSVLVGVILVIFGGNYLSVLPMLPTTLNLENTTMITITIGAVLCVVIMTIAMVVFQRKQL